MSYPACVPVVAPDESCKSSLLHLVVCTGKDQIERLLALGASRSEATADLVCRSVKLAMTPLLNTMSVVGLVSIPGQFHTVVWVIPRCLSRCIQAGACQLRVACSDSTDCCNITCNTKTSCMELSRR